MSKVKLPAASREAFLRNPATCPPKLSERRRKPGTPYLPVVSHRTSWRRRIIRLGVVGGARGRGFGYSVAGLKGAMVLTAVCDLNPAVCAAWQKDYPRIKTFLDYETMLDSDVVDAVLIATPMLLHVPQAIAALRRGIHVASEVTACVTLAEGRALIKAVERTKAVYFFAENYCYMSTHMQVEQMCRKGFFGEICYVLGSYYHDCCPLSFDARGNLTWRGEFDRTMNCSGYPTHSLGPIDRWLGIRAGRDRFVSVCAQASKASAITAYARRRFGPASNYAQPGFFKLGTTQKALIKTANGVLVDLLFDKHSPRVGNCAEHFIAGTEACFHSNTPIPYPDGMRAGPAISFRSKDGHYRWKPLSDYAARFAHPLWKEYGEAAAKAGHGGGDFFILREFADAIRGRCAPAIDVYDGVLWSAFIELTDRSIRTGRTVPVPNFRPRGK